jgi:hypothetical protein
VNDLSRWDSWQIIAEPFLDTTVSSDWHIAARAELKRRGIAGLNLYLRVVFAATGLWWNIFWWKWTVFGLKDILFGWALNIIGAASITIGALWHWYVGLAVFVISSILISWIARKLSANQPRQQ